MFVRRACVLGLLLLVAGCDMFGEYEARKQQTKARLMSGPAPAQPMPAAPADPNAAQPMPMPMMP